MVRVIGDAYVRIRALSDKLEDDIQKALDGSDANSKALGDKIGKSLRDGIDKNISDLDKVVKEKLDNVDAKIKVDVDDSEIRETAEKVKETFADESVKVNFDANFDDLKRKQQEFLERFGMDVAPIQLKAEVSKTSEERVKEQISDLIDDVENEDIELHPSVSEPFYRRVQSRFALLARPRSVSFSPEINEAAFAKVVTSLEALSGLRLLTTTASNISEALGNLDKSIPKIGLVTQAVGGLSAALLTSISNIFAVGLGLSQIAGAGLAIPGIFTGMAIGIGATVAVMKDLNSNLPLVGQEFAALQNSMSTEFWAIARDPMQDMIDTLFPEFSTGMRSVTNELGGFFASLSTSFSGELSGTLGGMFNALAESVTIATTKTDSMARIVRILGETGASYLPRLASWFGDVIEKFDGWLTRSQDTGALTGWIDLGIQRLKELGEILKNTGSILAGIARAAEAAGGSQLDMLADSLERVAEIVNGEPFQSNLIRVLQTAHKAMGDLADISGPAVTAFFENLSTLAPGVFESVSRGLGELVKGVATALSTDQFDNGLLALFEGIADAIELLEPMWGPLGDGVGALLTIIGSLATNFAPLLTTLLVAVSNLAVELAPSITSISEALSGVLGNVLEPLLAAATEIIVFFTGLIAPLAGTEGGIIAIGVALGVLATSLGVVKTGMAALTAVQSFPFLTQLASAAIGSRLGVTSSALGTMGTRVGTLVGNSRGLGPVVTNLGKLGGYGTILAAAALAVGAIGVAVSNIGVQAGNVEDLTSRLEDLAVTADSSATALNAMFQGQESGWSWLAGSVGGDDLNNLATDVTSLGDAFGYLDQWADANVWDRIWNSGDAFGGLGAHSAALNQSKESMLAFDQAMANVVRSGNPDQIAAAQRYLSDELKNAGLSYADVSEFMPTYNAALEDQKFALEAAAEAQKATNAAFIENTIAYENAMKSVNGATPQMLSAIQEGSLAFFDFGKDIGDAELSLESWVQSLEAQVAAQESWADNMTILSQRGISDGVLAEFAKLPDGAQRVAELANMSEEESRAYLERLNTIYADGMAGVVDETEGSFALASAAVAKAMEGINLNAIDGSGELAKTFEGLGFVVEDGVVKGLAEANIPDALSNALSGINIDELDGTGQLRAALEQAGYTIGADGFVVGVSSGIDAGSGLGTVANSVSSMLAANVPTTISEQLRRQLTDLGIQIPPGIAIGTQDNDGTILQAINGMLSDTEFAALPSDLKAKLNAAGGLMPGEVEAGVPAIAAGIATALAEMLGLSVPTTLPSTLTSTLNSLGLTLPNSIADGLENHSGTEVTAALQAHLDGVGIPEPTEQQKADLAAVGLEYVNGIIVGIENNTGSVDAPATALADGLLAGVKAGLGIASPSTEMITIGGFVVQGLINGLGQNLGGITTAAGTIVSTLLSAFSNPEGMLLGAGGSIVSSLISGITGKTPEAETSGKGVMDGVRRGLAGVTATDQGSRMGTEVTAGIRSKYADALGAGTNVAQGGKTGLGSQTANAEGTAIVTTYANAIRALVTIAQQGGQAVATAARAGLGSQTGTSAGQVLGQQFAQGLSAAQSGARTAGQAVNSAGVSGMAGGSAYNSGVSIGSTFASGIRATIASVRSAAQAVAAAARAALPNSPAEEGPFSGSGWGGWGESIGDEVARGLRERAESVRKAAQGMMSGVHTEMQQVDTDYKNVMSSVEESIAKINSSAVKVTNPNFNTTSSEGNRENLLSVLESAKMKTTARYRYDMHELRNQMALENDKYDASRSIDRLARQYEAEYAQYDAYKNSENPDAVRLKNMEWELKQLRNKFDNDSRQVIIQIDGREIARAVRDNDRRLS